MANKRYLLIDGYNLAYRSFYAVPDLSNENGISSNAVLGWLRILWKLQDQYSPDKICCFFDLGGSTRHLEVLESYKSHRKEMPDSLRKQIPLIKQATGYLGIQVVQQEGIEADDLIGSFAKKISQENNFAYIVSADKDFAQILEERIHQILPPPTANPKLGWQVLCPEGVFKKFGVNTKQIPDYLALIGDSADNIQGVPKVGPKTAQSWIASYGSLENILKNTSAIKPERFQNILLESESVLQRNLKMIRLSLDFEIKEENPSFQWFLLEELLESLNMQKTLAEAKKRMKIPEPREQTCFNF